MEEAKKILVVDDEPVLADLLRTKLSQKGFNVVEAHDGDIVTGKQIGRAHV